MEKVINGLISSNKAAFSYENEVKSFSTKGVFIIVAVYTLILFTGNIFLKGTA
jgi:hypothetical protein